MSAELAEARESFEQIERYAEEVRRETSTCSLVRFVSMAGAHAERIGDLAEELCRLAVHDPQVARDAASAIMLAADAEREAVTLAQRTAFFLEARRARQSRQLVGA